MPFYTYKCEKCEESIEKLRSINNSETSEICTVCGANALKTFDPGSSLGVIYKGWGWGDKNRKFGLDRAKKSKSMKSKQKSYYGNDKFVRSS